jgi:hypothetical protein
LGDNVFTQTGLQRLMLGLAVQVSWNKPATVGFGQNGARAQRPFRRPENLRRDVEISIQFGDIRRTS